MCLLEVLQAEQLNIGFQESLVWSLELACWVLWGSDDCHTPTHSLTGPAKSA